jgi:hypothetical protein
MVAGALSWLSIPAALFFGGVGGASNVPLGFVSLTENLMMIAMAAWMAAWMAADTLGLGSALHHQDRPGL